MTELSLRTIQRYQSLKSAFARLVTVIDKLEMEGVQDMMRDSLIQRFEFTIELCWNLQRDIAVDLGFLDVIGPKPAIQKAFEIGLINDFEIWKSMLKSRNLTSHTYNEVQSIDISNSIVNVYNPAITKFIQTIETKFDLNYEPK